MIRIRKFLLAAVAALTLAAPFLTAPQARAGDPLIDRLAHLEGFDPHPRSGVTAPQTVEIWTVPVWYEAPGQQWAVYGTYFVYRYPNGYTDNSEPLEVAKALNQAGYYSHFDNSQATFWRMGTR